MPIMRPSELPEEVRNEPFRKSEIVFFDAAKKLPENWYVLYGVTWYLKIRNNSWSEGEADFVIVSPETGLLIIEIKGGHIGRDEEGWFSIDRNQELHRIKDPALQASNCKHKLIESIKKHRGFSDRFIPSRHMVCFPNISEKDAPLLIDVPRETQILAEDFDNLKDHIISFAKRNYDNTIQPLSNKECKLIADILKPNFNCPERLSVQANRQLSIMDSLTDEQSYIIDMVEDNRRVSVYGPAGSGKTIIAIKLIHQCISNGESVLVLVPSKSLKNYYLTSTADRIDVAVYKDSCVKNNDKIYDLIIIDEAQDISEDCWLMLYENFNIENSEKFMCLFDSNQKLSHGGVSSPLEPLMKLRLTKVLRNTQQIANFSKVFYSSFVDSNIVGPSGLNVQFSTVTNDNEIVPKVISAIKHYVFEENFDYSDIVVLFAEKGKSWFKKEANNINNKIGVSFRSLRAYDEGYTYKSPIVIAESVYSFRGLESKIVILCDIDDVSNDIKSNACYIGSSRARSILHIIAKKETIDLLNNQL